MPISKDTGVTVDAANVINDILSFCAQGVDGRDLLAQAEYAADVQRSIGHQPGIARQELANKQARQASHMSAGLAQFLARRYAGGVKDDGDLDKIETALVSVIMGLLESRLPGLATLLQPGLVMPDGVTIKVDGSGKLTVPDVYVRLTTDLTIYVATTGDDSNDGLTAATPLRTVQGALNKVSTSYNLGEHTVTISVAEGTYTESVALPKYQASIGLIKIIGTGVDKTVVGGAGSGAMSLSFDAVYIVQSLTLTADKGIGDTPRCLLATSGSITCSNVKFVLPASATGPYPVCIYSYGSGQINLGGNDGLPLILSIASAMAALFAIGGGKITINNPLTITATMLGQCAYAVNSGVISRNQTTMPAISGAVTGARYQSSVNGVINTSGGGASYFPGTIAGSVNMGGQYA